MAQSQLKYPILLAIFAALTTFALKWVAYYLTGSVGLLSEAAESVVNLLASITALFSLWYSSRPVDPTHTYGHEKIEYFSSGLEGALILVAAAGITWYAIERLVKPQALEAVGAGILISVLAALVNFAVAQLLLRIGTVAKSIVLEAGGRHLMTDVFTTLAVVLGLGLYRLTQLPWLDAVLGLLVAANIIWTGVNLLRRSFDGLMDHALPVDEQSQVRKAIEVGLLPGMHYHALRTREAGSRRFADFHLLVPGALSVRRAHELTKDIEEAIRSALPGIEVTVHIEPIEDQASWHDSELLPVERAAEQVRFSESEPSPK